MKKPKIKYTFHKRGLFIREESKVYFFPWSISILFDFNKENETLSLTAVDGAMRTFPMSVSKYEEFIKALMCRDS